MGNRGWLKKTARAFIGVMLGTAALPFVASPAHATTAPTCGSGGTPAVVALADPSFYIDSSSGLDSTYAGYTVRAGTTAENSLWLTLDGFTGGSVALAPGQPSATALPNLAANTTATAYALLRASAATTTAQTHTVTLYRGHPSANDVVCTRTFTYSGVYETIKALANKVTSVTASTPPGGGLAHIGDTVTVNVTGHTGQLGAGPTLDPGVLSYAPDALSSFPAGAWRLEKTTMNISPDGVAAATTYTNRLYLPAASGPDRPYTAEYLFRAIGPADSASAVQPVQYIASGTQVKHTDIAGSVSGVLPQVSREGNVQVAKTASSEVLPSTGGSVTYTVTATNFGAAAATIDRLVDTLPSGSTYTAGTSTLGGRTSSDPAVSGRQLTWSGPITVPAGGTLALTYDTTVPAVAGPHTNAAVAYYGEASYDASRDVTVSNPASATVTVLDAAGSAKAVNDSATTTANQTVLVDVLTNDSSTGNFPLSISAVGTPGHGTATIRTGQVAYTPTTGYAGADSFAYTLSDGYSTATATVSVTVNPIANNDVYVTNKSTTLNGGTVLANDACTGCTVSLVTNVSTGTLTLNSNGTFTYVAPNQNTTVTFTYKATASGSTANASATATIYVNAAGPDYATTPYDTDATIAVTTNDTCPGGGNCNISAATSPSHGTVTYSGLNTIYNPNAGFWGLDSFTYSLNGGAGATVTILTAPPAASLSTTFGNPVGGTAGSAALTGATPACSGCTYSLATSPAHGRVSINSTTGAFTYTPDSGFAGADSFAYGVTDPTTGLNVAGTVNVNVGPDAADDAFTVAVRHDTALSILANDSCPGTCTVTLLTSPARGTVTLNGDNTVTFSSAPTNDIGVVSFQYRISSSLASSITDTATVTVTVEGATDDTASTTPGQAVNVDVLANDPCTDCTVSALTTPTAGAAAIENDGTVTYTPAAGFSGSATFDYTVAKNGFTSTATVTITVLPQAVDDAYATSTGTPLDIDPRTNDLCAACVITAAAQPSGGGSAVIDAGGGGITYAPGVGAGQTETFTYTVRDTAAHTTSATVTVTVNAPPAAADDYAITNAETPVTIDVQANDTCTNCSVDVTVDAAHGTVVFRADGQAQYSPAAGFSGRDSFDYAVTDPATGLSATTFVTVDVRPRAADDTAATAAGTPVAIDVLANDVCTDCRLTILDYPVQGSITVDSPTTITYTPTDGFEGTDTFRYELTDLVLGWSVAATANVTVSNATADAATTTPDTSVDVSVLANDFCSGCSILSVGTPAHGTAAAVGSVIRYTPDSGFWGLDAFTYRSGTGSAGSQATVTVLTAPPARTVTTGKNTAASGDLLGSAPCAGCVFAVSRANIAGDITINSDGTWSYSPPADATPTDTLTYSVHDPASGTTVTGTLTIVVRASTITVTVDVVNDSGGTATAADFPLTVNGMSVSSGAANDFPAGVQYTVSQTLADGYAQTGLVCVDADTSANVGHPFTLSGGQHVACTVTDDDLAMTPQLTLTKTAGAVVDANASGRVDAGDTISYSYAVSDTGNTTVTGITVTDDKLAPSAIACETSGDNTIASLDPGGSASCGATYTVTQADVDAGSVTNVADVSGSGGGVTATDSATVALDQANALAVTDAESSRTGNAVGDVISYHAVAANTGTTTLTNVVLDDPLTGGHQDCGTLAPTQTCALDSSYALTQADLDAAVVDDTANGTGTGPQAASVADSDAVQSAVTAAPASLDVAKSVASETDVDHSGDRNVGDVIRYSVVATNIGERTAHDVVVTDDLTGDSQTCASVAPGGTCTLFTDHTITLAEALANTVNNTAGAVGTDAPQVTTELDLPVVHHQGLHVTVELVALDQTAAGPADRVDAGDHAHYRYTVTNTGDSVLNDVDLTGPLSLDIACPVTNSSAVGSIDAGATVTCDADHALTQAEVDGGSLDAGVSASGVTLALVAVDDAAALTTPLPAAPAVVFAKTVAAGDASSSCPTGGHSLSVVAGTTVTWCFGVTNTGNVTLSDVRVDDALLGLSDSGAQPSVVSGITTLAPGSALAAASTAAASADLANTATAGGVHDGVRTRSAADTAGLTVFAATSYTVSGVVWFDVNHNGTRDSGEPVLPGANVSLVSGAGAGAVGAAVAAASANPAAVAVTGADGRYRFAEVAPGAYSVVAKALAASLPPSWDTDGQLDWQVAVVVGGADVTADFATTPTGGLMGTATNRVTGAPVPNAEIDCTWAGLDGVPGTADDVSFSTAAGADGSYSLGALPPGSFACTAVDPVTKEQAVFDAVVLATSVSRANVELGAVGGASTARPRVAAGPLPRTGLDPRRAVYPGLALIVAGCVLVTLGRRRSVDG